MYGYIEGKYSVNYSILFMSQKSLESLESICSNDTLAIVNGKFTQAVK